MEYTNHTIWTGNTGTGTSAYDGYSRSHEVHIVGKPPLACSADQAFRGDAGLHNPEDLFLAAIASCHMLFYLSLCARQSVVVQAYEDRPTGTLRLLPGGGGRFDEVVLSPMVVIAEGSDATLALRLHDTAHELCFIASSCSVPIRHEPDVHFANPVRAS